MGRRERPVAPVLPELVEFVGRVEAVRRASRRAARRGHILAHLGTKLGNIRELHAMLFRGQELFEALTSTRCGFESHRGHDCDVSGHQKMNSSEPALGFGALSLRGAAGVTATDVVATACAGHRRPTPPRTRSSFETSCVAVDSAGPKKTRPPGLTVQISSCRSIRTTGERAHDLWRGLSHS